MATSHVRVRTSIRSPSATRNAVQLPGHGDWPRMLRNGAKLTLRGSYAPTTAQPQLPCIFPSIEEISRSFRCTRLSNYVDAILFHDLAATPTFHPSRTSRVFGEKLLDVISHVDQGIKSRNELSDQRSTSAIFC